MRRRLSYWSKMLEGGGEGCEEKWVKRVRGRDLKMGGGQGWEGVVVKLPLLSPLLLDPLP